MRRRPVHTGFAIVAAGLATFIGNELVTLRGDRSPDSPRAQLEQALVLMEQGEIEAAEAVFERLVREKIDAPVSRSARFNLANVYLRAGIAEADPGRSRSLVELAKQRYRDLLRIDPADWDARYNLERALSLVPEESEVGWSEISEPIKSVDVVIKDFAPTDLP